MSLNTKSLYRSIYRQLSRQHAEASKIHLEKDTKRVEALRKYAAIKARASGQPESSLPQIEDPKVSRYPSNSLRSIFLEKSKEYNNSDNTQGKESGLNANTNEIKSQNLSKSIAAFLESQRMYNHLLEYYNGSTIDEEKKLELSAKRVGLELPDSFPKDGKK